MRYRYWFMNVKEISEEQKCRLVEQMGSTKEIYHATEKKLQQMQILKPKQLAGLLEHRSAWDLETEYKSFARQGDSFVTVEDEAYPFRLRQICHRPYGMYVKGRLPEQDRNMIAIVGSRQCSPYGKKIAEELAEALAEAGYVIISGMARGIDGCAHRGCLAGGGHTVAVLGSGVDVCYPKEHATLYQKICEQGCVLSEFPHGCPPLASNFPQRNRIISGMATRVIVVEAREKSGSLITAELALEQNRDVYAVPGRMTDLLSQGCNRLIGEGAGVITSVPEFLSHLEEMDYPGTVRARKPEIQKNFLEKEETLVYSCFDFYPKSVDAVLEETGMDLLRLLSIVMDLCDKGYLREYVKNQYVRCK